MRRLHRGAVIRSRWFISGIWMRPELQDCSERNCGTEEEHPDLAEHLEVLFYGHMAANDKVYLIDHELLDVVKIKNRRL